MQRQKLDLFMLDLLAITAGHTNMIELDWQLKKHWGTKLKQRLWKASRKGQTQSGSLDS